MVLGLSEVPGVSEGGPCGEQKTVDGQTDWFRTSQDHQQVALNKSNSGVKRASW